MLKKLHLFCIVFSLGMISLNAQTQDIAPFAGTVKANLQNQSKSALFDVLFNYDMGTNGTPVVAGMAGVIFFNNQFWVSEWQTDQIHVLDNTGAYVESFNIPGITGTRSFTTDGTSIYIGTAGLQIFEVDPSTRTLVSTISVTTTSTAEARMVTYDATLDSGNGGFWIGDFSSDIASIDMNGNELSVIPAATHGTAIYGGAVDNVSPGNPYLWIHDQNGTDPNRDFIVQLQLPSGTPTGVVYDYTADAIAGTTAVLAGGLFVSSDVDPNSVALVGLCQCTPNNSVFGLELTSLGIEKNSLSEGFALYPNPAEGGVVMIETSFPGAKKVSVFNVLGKKVIDTSIENDVLSVSSLVPGIYMVNITQKGQNATKKLVVR